MRDTLIIITIPAAVIVVILLLCILLLSDGFAVAPKHIHTVGNKERTGKRNAESNYAKNGTDGYTVCIPEKRHSSLQGSWQEQVKQDKDNVQLVSVVVIDNLTKTPIADTKVCLSVGIMDKDKKLLDIYNKTDKSGKCVFVLEKRPNRLPLWIEVCLGASYFNKLVRMERDKDEYVIKVQKADATLEGEVVDKYGFPIELKQVFFDDGEDIQEQGSCEWGEAPLGEEKDCIKVDGNSFRIEKLLERRKYRFYVQPKNSIPVPVSVEMKEKHMKKTFVIEDIGIPLGIVTDIEGRPLEKVDVIFTTASRARIADFYEGIICRSDTDGRFSLHWPAKETSPEELLLHKSGDYALDLRKEGYPYRWVFTEGKFLRVIMSKTASKLN